MWESFNSLYYIDDNIFFDSTIKVIGHQWFWEFNDINLFMVNSLNFGTFPFLEIDNPIVINNHSDLLILTTSMDVIHSLTIPSLGFKIDSIPGKINESVVHILRKGWFFGQCSELCGYGHSFMPICFVSV